MDDWMLGVLGWESEAAYRSFLETKRVILDAGCGNGRETARIARLNPEALIVGLDISSAVDHAARNSAGLENVRFIQGDLCTPPLIASSFDYILSFGVLHHTPSTREALFSLLRLLRPGGECAFYVYRKKAPLREFADDYVRARLQSMTTGEAWQEMEHLTMFARALSDLNCTIEVPEDIPTLGIQAGRHNLQRLIYYTMFKCYWRDSFSFDDNVHVNFDWYYPRYAWRHTRIEVAQWIADANMDIVMDREIDAGYSFRITPARRSAG